uniref:Transposase n=1 Tax=Heterorhabditis bacteriophora TaxID=37862 RepID=A0A1I7XIN9_HETBA
MEVHQGRFVDTVAFATEFAATRSEFVASLPESLVSRSEFAATTADVRQFTALDCASRMNGDEDFVYAPPLKVSRRTFVLVKNLIVAFRWCRLF